MNKTTALILTLATVFLCGCPGISFCLVFFYSFTVTPEQAIIAAGGTPSGDLTITIWGARVGFVVGALVLIAIPIVTGLLTNRAAKKSTL